MVLRGLLVFCVEVYLRFRLSRSHAPFSAAQWEKVAYGYREHVHGNTYSCAWLLHLHRYTDDRLVRMLLLHIVFGHVTCAIEDRGEFPIRLRGWRL
jgi:hypothetical protein